MVETELSRVIDSFDPARGAPVTTYTVPVYFHVIASSAGAGACVCVGQHHRTCTDTCTA
jgi:hypothetical protein